LPVSFLSYLKFARCGWAGRIKFISPEPRRGPSSARDPSVPIACDYNREHEQDYEKSLALLSHPLSSVAHDFSRARHAELFFNVGTVCFDGFFAQMQLARDLVHVVAFAD